MKYYKKKSHKYVINKNTYVIKSTLQDPITTIFGFDSDGIFTKQQLSEYSEETNV